MAPETVVTVEHKTSPQQGPPPQQGGALDWLKFNIDYFKTPPGILKIIELVLGILCMALVSGNHWSGSGWFCFVAVTSFITTLMWSFVYLLSIREALKLPINWVASELISTGIQTVLYFIAFIVQFASPGHVPGHLYGSSIAAAVFGMFITVAYAGSTYLLYQEHKGVVGTTAA